LAAARVGLGKDRPNLAGLAIEGAVDVYESCTGADCRANRAAISTITVRIGTMRARGRTLGDGA
jgi:hypothetical protein